MPDYGISLDDRFRIERFDESGVDAEEIVDLWLREGVLSEEEARRRVGEVHLVGLERDEGVVGVTSAYLQRNAQLHMDLWYYRAFVASRHRENNLAVLLAMRGRDDLKHRYVTGADTRAAGIVYEVESRGLKAYFNTAVWLPTEFTFIGENERGDHVRVHWFPGAKVPPAPR